MHQRRLRDSTHNMEHTEKLQKSLQSELLKLETEVGRPLIKETHLCSANCCDSVKPGDADGFEACIRRCNAKAQALEQIVSAHLGEFQKKFERCAMRCQDKANDSLMGAGGTGSNGSGPLQKDISKAEKLMDSCVADCSKEFKALIPKTMKQIRDDVNKL